MTYLDGNAIAGLLFDVFGNEMTATLCVCIGCGHSQAFAETTVFLGGPGIVIRCAGCEGLLAVVVERHGIRCVDVSGIASMGPRFGAR